MRTPLIRAAAGTFIALWLLLMALPLTAAADTATKVPNKEEAWFISKKEPLAELPQGDPTCTLPTGCNVAGNATRQQSGHPEGTLVVAANAGDPDAQTFINFDSFVLPPGAVITGGTVNLPVARDPEANNSNAENAKMVACLVTGFIADGTDAGSFKDRPAWDEKVCEPVTQVKDAEDLTFTVNLDRFGKVWSSGTGALPPPVNGITLMVDPEIEPPAPQETWRVVFNSRRRAQQQTEREKKDNPAAETRMEYPAITSTLQYKVVKLPGFGTPPPPPPPPGGGGTITPSGSTGGGEFTPGTSTTTTTPGSPGFSGGTGSVAPPSSSSIDTPAGGAAAPVDVPVAAGGETAAAPTAASPVAAQDVGISPAVWVMPVLALAMAGAMAWSLMHPVELAGNREGAVSRLMRTRRLSASTPSTP